MKSTKKVLGVYYGIFWVIFVQGGHLKKSSGNLDLGQYRVFVREYIQLSSAEISSHFLCSSKYDKDSIKNLQKIYQLAYNFF